MSILFLTILVIYHLPSVSVSFLYCDVMPEINYFQGEKQLFKLTVSEAFVYTHMACFPGPLWWLSPSW